MLYTPLCLQPSGTNDWSSVVCTLHACRQLLQSHVGLSADAVPPVHATPCVWHSGNVTLLLSGWAQSQAVQTCGCNRWHHGLPASYMGVVATSMLCCNPGGAVCTVIAAATWLAAVNAGSDEGHKIACRCKKPLPLHSSQPLTAGMHHAVCSIWHDSLSILLLPL